MVTCGEGIAWACDAGNPEAAHPDYVAWLSTRGGMKVEMVYGRPGDWVGGRRVVCLGNGSASVQGSKPPPSGATVESCRRGERPLTREAAGKKVHVKEVGACGEQGKHCT
ncbi:hypothetical protein E2C01_023375 [Portunus trituberculatus]|uniref:Uncharacterized protein n=1 Tax=Portunus trituberculatus TaxID=210409 RepID=A0A5B7EA81_PORTR|nr:hypothetical protein [Portunus trituberculatus]